MTLTNAQRQRAYRHRKNPPTRQAFLVTRFKEIIGHISYERLDTMLLKWESELVPKRQAEATAKRGRPIEVSWGVPYSMPRT